MFARYYHLTQDTYGSQSYKRTRRGIWTSELIAGGIWLIHRSGECKVCFPNVLSDDFFCTILDGPLSSWCNLNCCLVLIVWVLEEHHLSILWLWCLPRIPLEALQNLEPWLCQHWTIFFNTTHPFSGIVTPTLFFNAPLMLQGRIQIIERGVHIRCSRIWSVRGVTP